MTATGFRQPGLPHLRKRVDALNNTKFWDRIAEGYAKKPVADETAYQRKLEITQSYLRSEMNVLEFGCGSGSTAIEHAPFVRHVLATDLSSKMIEIARRRAEAAQIANVEFKQCGIEDFEAPDGSFDVVLALSLLHLLEDKQTAISKVHKLLKPGGLFVSSTACLGDTMSYFKFIAPAGRALGLIPLVKVFTTQDLDASLKVAGFEIIEHWQPGKGKAVFVVARKPE